MPCRSGFAGYAAAVACAAGMGLSGCATTAPAPATPASPVAAAPASLDTRVAWILRLEQQRILRDATLAAAPAAAAPSPAAPRVLDRASNLSVATEPDLAALSTDSENLIRSRAVLAIGRVGMPEGATLLQAALQDPVAEVRANAAFAMGLLGSKEALPALQGASADPSALVRARAVEALGLIADPSSVPFVSQAASGCAAPLSAIEPDDEEWPKTEETEVCRQAIFALVRLRSYDGLAHLLLNAQGEPVTRWWPAAFALQRIGDPRAARALRTFAATPGLYTAGFALRGLASLKDQEVLPLARTLASRADADMKLRIAAVRLIGQSGTQSDVATLTSLLTGARSSTQFVVEVINALGALGQPAVFDVLLDYLNDPAPEIRAVVLSAAAKSNPDGFLLVLAGMSRDRDWSVRAALASVLGTLPGDIVKGAIVDLVEDEDARVHGAALEALAAIKAPELATRLVASLQAPDFVERATAAKLIGEAKIEGGVAHLVEAYTRGESDTAFAARAAALESLALFGGDQAMATLRRALADREWPVRARAASLLRGMGQADAEPLRPAPVRWSGPFFESDALLRPQFSPHAFIDTRHGAIEVQLDVVNAPLTSTNFVELSRQGFYNGMKVHRVVPAFVLQTGDPRGDGSGGPGHTIREELSPVPYLRGTIGMAIDGAETGGSQWFITTTPQPHLDAKYTAFGRVVGGWDVLDRIGVGDVIERIRIWDGVDFR